MIANNIIAVFRNTASHRYLGNHILGTIILAKASNRVENGPVLGRVRTGGFQDPLSLHPWVLDAYGMLAARYLLGTFQSTAACIDVRVWA
jgi:hypothetical protein